MLLALMVFGFSAIASAQTKLNGKWTATSPMEINDNGNISVCDLVSFTIDEKENTICVNEIELNFTETELEILKSNSIAKIKYENLYKKDEIKFSFNNNDYHFKVIDIDVKDVFLLRNSDKTLLVLKRKKN